MNDQLGIQVGRPFGGIGVLWRKSISHACTICDLQDNRLLGIDIDTNDGKLFILNVSLPYQSSDNFEEFCNYLIALVTVASKIFEIMLLEMLTPYLNTTDNQFGFKKGHSTDHCIFALKNLIQYYKSNNSPVYSCFLDASKAFDRVNHWTLLKNCLVEVCLLYLYVFCCIGTEPKHSVSNGVLQHQSFLMFRMVFDKVEFCPRIYLSYTLMI